MSTIFTPEERTELVATFGEPYVLRLEQRARAKHEEDDFEEGEDDILGLNTAISSTIIADAFASLNTNDDSPSGLSGESFGFGGGESGNAGAGGSY